MYRMPNDNIRIDINYQLVILTIQKTEKNRQVVLVLIIKLTDKANFQQIIHEVFRSKNKKKNNLNLERKCDIDSERFFI